MGSVSAVREKYNVNRKETSMKKKITFAIALCMAVCSVAGCSGEKKETQTTTSAEVTETASESAAPGTEASVSETTEEEAPEETVAETVVVDSGDVFITARGFRDCEEYDDEPVLDLNISNKTGQPLTIFVHEASINGWMFDPDTLTVDETGYLNIGGALNVPAENDTNKYSLHIGDYVLQQFGLSEINEIEFSLEVVCGEEGDKTLYGERVTVKNPDASGAEQTYDDSGDVAYDKDGLKVVVKGADYEPDFWGPTVRLYAYNSSDKTLRVRIPKSTLNGEEHMAFGDFEITPGKHVLESVMFENAGSLPPLGTVELTFDIYDYDPTGEGTLLDTSEKFTAEFEPVEVVRSVEGATEEEIAEAKGWWTREGEFTDGNGNSLTLTFLSTSNNLDENVWYANGNFDEKIYWGGNVSVTDAGLEGPMSTVTFSEAGEVNAGENFDVKISEEGDNGILLAYGTEGEYHFTPVPAEDAAAGESSDSAQ